MAYIKGSRNQMALLPASIEDYIAEDDPVRAYDAFIEALDLSKVGILLREEQAGAAPYWPKAMLKLLIYGYAYGIRSSRKLERACHHNLSFIWLVEGIKPDYRTIARFRIDNKTALKEVLGQCARMCLKLDLIDGNTLFVDGTKIKANASYKNTWSEEDCRKYEAEIAGNIERILEECERADSEESSAGSLMSLKKELVRQEELRAQVQAIASELQSKEKQKLNTTDGDSFVSKADCGTKMYHNVQMTVDEKHGLVINVDVVAQNNDANQLSVQTKQAQEVLAVKPKAVCADSGYHSIEDAKKIDTEVQIIVPSQGQITKERGKAKEFPKEDFKYDKTADEYICPEGEHLGRTKLRVLDRENFIVYKAKASVCKRCKNFGKCTTSALGRKIARHRDEELSEHMATIYLSDEGQRIYGLRKQKVELPFAHIKHNMGLRHLLLRGVHKVIAEAALCAISFNITRMIALLGVKGLQNTLAIS